jgi:hypothetical protein
MLAAMERNTTCGGGGGGDNKHNGGNSSCVGGWAPLFFIGLYAEVLQKLANNGKVRITGKVFSRQTNLLHLIEAVL